MNIQTEERNANRDGNLRGWND